MTQKCTLLLGGSFDPVHTGHVELGQHFCRLFDTNILRLIPTGNPWQKSPLSASANHRVAMLKCAFSHLGLTVSIDCQEIQRSGATYSYDTLVNIRNELGKSTPLIFLIGADQLHRLHTWYKWQKLFDLTHFAISTRAGFPKPLENLSPEVANIILPRIATAQELMTAPAGKILIDDFLQLDISATEIRNAFKQNKTPPSLIPSAVIDYIYKHNLYRN